MDVDAIREPSQPQLDGVVVGGGLVEHAPQPEQAVGHVVGPLPDFDTGLPALVGASEVQHPLALEDAVRVHVDRYLGTRGTPWDIGVRPLGDGVVPHARRNLIGDGGGVVRQRGEADVGVQGVLSRPHVVGAHQTGVAEVALELGETGRGQEVLVERRGHGDVGGPMHQDSRRGAYQHGVEPDLTLGGVSGDHQGQPHLVDALGHGERGALAHAGFHRRPVMPVDQRGRAIPGEVAQRGRRTADELAVEVVPRLQLDGLGVVGSDQTLPLGPDAGVENIPRLHVHLGGQQHLLGAISDDRG